MDFMMQLRNQVEGESLDYLFLMDRLKGYRSPRAKITQLLKREALIRVKKGLYVFGPLYKRGEVQLESLANKIYGPSYVSMEYALSYYGMIPEHVREVTSVTTKRKKYFTTPVGRFSYTPLPLKLYREAVTYRSFEGGEGALIATAEKALADLFYVRKFDEEIPIDELLFGHLRLDEESVKRFDGPLLRQIAEAGGSKLLYKLMEWVEDHAEECD